MARYSRLLLGGLAALLACTGCDSPQEAGSAQGALTGIDAGASDRVDGIARRSDAGAGLDEADPGAAPAPRRFRPGTSGVELDTEDPGIRFVIDGGAIYLVRGDERILVLEPARFERGGHPVLAAGEGTAAERGGRLSIARGDGVDEWYAPHPRGLEQGWDVGRRLGGRTGPLEVVLTLGPEVSVMEPGEPPPSRDPAEATAAGEEDDPGVLLMVRDVLVSYSELAVTDSSGVVLPARLVARAGAIVLEVDDERAGFPITIDPLVALSGTDVNMPGSLSRTLQWGTAITVDGGNMFVGQPDLPAGGGFRQGAVHHYTWTGSSWNHERRIRVTGTGNAAFGRSVSAHGDWLIVGAYAVNSVYAIRLSAGFSGSSSNATPNVGGTPITSSVFGLGLSVSISGTRFVAGSLANQAHVYNYSGSSWSTSAANQLTGTGNFGISAALDRQNANLLVVGAPAQSPRGIAHVYRWSGSSWGTSTQITPPYSDETRFGVSVAVDGERIAIGCLAYGEVRAEAVRALYTGSSWNTASMLVSAGFLSTSETFAYGSADRSPWVTIARDPLGGTADVIALGLPNGVASSAGTGLVEGTVDVYPSGSNMAAARRVTFCGTCAVRHRGRAVATDGRRIVHAFDTYGAYGWAHSHNLVRTNGESCTAHGECQSGFCVDGVCCNSSCGSGSTTDCMACSTGYGGTSNGTCTALSATFAPTVMCRAASGEACDVADYCVAGSTVCTNSYRPSSYLCRSAPGACDLPEYCTGTSPTCPTNAVQPAGTVCRSYGPCDIPEECDGTSVDCPPDALAPAGTICRASAGACDLAEQCSGTSAACPADAYAAGGTVCRGSAGECDVAEVCSGAGPSCPSDSILPAGTTCRAAAGACDVAEQCSGSDVSCPADVLVGGGTVCRAAAGACDVAELCSGADAACPADVLVSGGTVCRAAAGTCDVAELCSGTDGACPGDAFVAGGTLCRAASDACDAPELCPGIAPDCPADSLLPSSHVCRASVAPCDAEETCDGVASGCPPDLLHPAGTICSPAGGSCDVEERCDGVVETCPTDALAVPGAICRPVNPSTPCDVMEVCSGRVATCPDDVAGASCQPGTIDNSYGTSTLDPPPLAPGADFADGLAFLHEGPDPYQRLATGGALAAGTIVEERAAGIFGYVYDVNGLPIAGAQVSVLHHDELGVVPTRTNGRYDIVVNGGGPLTIQVDLPLHIPVQRTVGTEWNDFYAVDDIVLTPYDVPTAVTQNHPSFQVVQGSITAPAGSCPMGETCREDADGFRRATILIPPGTTVLGDGMTLSTVTMRATELTVGSRGPNAMPGELPLASAYNYAVELDVIEAGAGNVEFRDSSDDPVQLSLYVENFLKHATAPMPVGADVPLGYYDRDRATWVAAPSGRVIEILAPTGGAAGIDMDGDGFAESDTELEAIGLTIGERQQLALLYAPGTELWRVRVDHFTPWDCNWPYGPPDGAEPARLEVDRRASVRDCEYTGSIIRCESQVLGEEIPLAGTDLALRYSSGTVPGRRDLFTINAQLSQPPGPPDGYLMTLVSVSVAGQQTTIGYDVPPSEFHWHWDGRDGFGRPVPDRVPAVVLACHVYSPVLNAFGNFSRFSSGTVSMVQAPRFGRAFSLCDRVKVYLGAPNHGEDAFLGWQLNALARRHRDGDVTRGDGTELEGALTGGVIDTLVGEDAYLRREAPGLRLVPEGWSIANSPWAPTALHHEPDGSLLVAYNRPTDDLPHWNAYPRLVRISSAGVTHLAGAPCPNPSEACDYGTLAEVEAEEGLNATDVPLGTIRAAELAPDGSFFLIENGTFVRRIAPNGAISRVAGIGNVGSSTGNDGPALEAGIENARDLAVAPDGTIYLLEGQVRVRQIGTDAIISQVLERSVAGTPSCWHTDPGHCHPCRRDLWAPGDPLYGATPQALDVSPQGDLLVALDDALRNAACVVRVLPDGGLRRVTGFGPNGEGSTEGDGVPALEFRPGMIVGVQAGQDAIYLRTRHGDYPYRYAVHVVRDGYVFPAAVEDDAWGTTAIHDFTDAIVPAGLRTNADFGSTFALAPGGEVSIATYQNTTSFGAIQRLYTAHAAGVRDGGVWLDFEDKRHVRTRDATTGTTLRTFERNPDGVLTAIVDADGNRVEVQRGTGYVRFVPPFGPATRIEDTDDDGWADRVEYEDAALRGYDLDHDEHGLLQSIARPDGLTHQFIYDELGRLIRDEQPGGRVARLTRRPTEIDLETRRLTQEVTYTSPGGRSTTHETEFGRPGSSTRRTLTHPDGTTTVVEELPRRPIVTEDGLEGVHVRETRATASDGTVTELFETIGNGAGFSDPLPARTTITTPAPSSRQLHLEQTRARTHDPATGELLTETRTHTRRGGSTSRTVTSSYDAATRTFTTTLPSELSSSTVLDASDRPVEVRAPGLAPLQMGYDARGRILWSRRVSATGHGTREVSYDYTDPVLGELWTPSTVTSAGTRTHLSFDDLRRVTSGVTLPVSCMLNADCDDGVGCNGEETCASGECVPGATNTCSMFAYDTVDRLTGVRPLGREEHGLGYDAADRGISYTPPVLTGPSGQVDLARDPDGLVSRVDVDAGPTRSVVTSRHPDGRPQSVQHEGHTITFGYHATTRELTSLETEDGITVSLDTDGPLLESVTWSGSAGVAGAVAFGYDELWDLTTITAGGVAASYHYDEDGALDCVAPGGTADATCASGLLIAPNLPAGTLVMSMAGAASVMSSYEWSDLGEATQTVHQWSTTGELSFTYDERDGEGRLTRVIEDDGAGDLVLEYSYDVEGRLIEVKRDGVVSESYEYDPNSQRSGATRDGVAVAPIAWDARDRLTQYGGVAYDYDPAGRRTTRTEGGRTTTYTYDLLGALRAVDLPDTTNDIEYLIDAAGRRVGRKVGPIGSGTLERAWIYLDGLRPIVEMDGSGTVTRIFVYGAGRAPDLIVVPAGQPDAGTYRVLTDHLDSVRRVVDVESGAVIQQLDYDAFGNVLVDTNPGWQPFGFAAGLYDPGARDPACVLAGGRYCGALVRFGARDYDPEIGQWTARDPILFSGRQANLYTYCAGDPTNHVDFVGLDKIRVVVRVGSRIIFRGPISFDDAVTWILRGGDVYTTKARAKALARAASARAGGQGLVQEGGHKIGYYAHCHPLRHDGRRLKRAGHAFFGAQRVRSFYLPSLSSIIDSNFNGRFDAFDVFDLAHPLGGIMPNFNLSTNEIYEYPDPSFYVSGPI